MRGRPDDRRRSHGRAVHPLVPAQRPDLDLASTIARDRPGFAELLEHLKEVATTAWRVQYDERLGELEEQHVPPEAARFGATVPDLPSTGPTCSPWPARAGARSPRWPTPSSPVGERLFLNMVEQRVSRQPAKTRWQRLAWRSQLDDLRLLRRQIVRARDRGRGRRRHRRARWTRTWPRARIPTRA